MNQVLTEREYQEYIQARLCKSGYIAKSSLAYNAKFAIDEEELFRFLEQTQSDTLAELRKFHGDKLRQVIISTINLEEQKSKGGRLNVLKHGVYVDNRKLTLMYTKPATTYNKEQTAKYEANIFSVTQEVQASPEERVDLVLFLNGLAIVAFELKCNAAGQSYQHAIRQFRNDRNPKTRLFQFKAGVLVNFAMDLNEVYMTTKLDRSSTVFLPFNRGYGEGIEATAGNPPMRPGDEDFPVAYMWNDVLQKDALLDIISRFMFLDVKEPETPRGKGRETMVFPRFHQLDVIRKLVADVSVNESSRNYLLQHSAGSGKTNEIAWLSHRLATLHNAQNEIIFHKVIVCTDRVVVDRQLQRAIMGIEHKESFIRVMKEGYTSVDLAKALKGSSSIIVTTIQKFPYVLEQVDSLNDKRFAVIIDESHSSTAGKTMQAVKLALGSETTDAPPLDVEEAIERHLHETGKQVNVAMFGFTATPKPTTLSIFGTTDTAGRKAPFHIYSMKQAIEEGFILDVLRNYVTYQTYYRLNKEIESDPEVKTSAAKRQIARYAATHDLNIRQRIEIIIEHFRTTVMRELNGAAKAMVVSSSREAAVKLRLAADEYIRERGYDDLHAIVAFSGKVVLDDEVYTESGMNGFSEKNLPEEFDSDRYQLLLVADKYQTGFDQRKLCAMYILKKLRGVAAVQTLSRLNRVCPPHDKKTFVLDFENQFEDIAEAFSKYYAGTILAQNVSPSDVDELVLQLEGYGFIDHDDVEEFSALYLSGEISQKAQIRMTKLLQTAKDHIDEYEPETAKKISLAVRHFVRFYEFLEQATCLDAVELHKLYIFLSCLRGYLLADEPGAGFSLRNKIGIKNVKQKKTSIHKGDPIASSPIVSLPSASVATFTEDKVVRLSKLIEEINARMGVNLDADVASKALLQIRDLLRKSEDLQIKAKNNTLSNFLLAFFSDADNALVEGLDQNMDFFSLLLQNQQIKEQLLQVFAEDLYLELRGKK